MAESVVDGAPDGPNRNPAETPAPEAPTVAEGPAKSKRDRGGRPELAPEERRDHQVGVRLNAAEWQRLKDRAGAIPPASYLRVAGLEGMPPVVPEVNREALAQLPALAGNVNQIAARLNAGRIGELTGPDRVLLDQVRAALVALQQSLVGRKGAVTKQAVEFAAAAVVGPVAGAGPLDMRPSSAEDDARVAAQFAAHQAARPGVLDAARSLFRKRGAPS